MTSSQKSKLAAVIGYILVTVLVLGGMSWATIATFELAKRNFREENLRNKLLAVSEMDSYMRGILRSEKARPFTDYFPHHTIDYVQVLNETREQLEAGMVIVESPLKESGPPYAWIDLNFQVHENGEWSSPQLGVVSPGVDPIVETETERRAADTMAWFRRVMSESDLWQEARLAAERRDALHAGRRTDYGEEGARSETKRGRKRDKIADWTASDFQRRRQSDIAAQQQTRSLSQCAHVIEPDTDFLGHRSFRTRNESQFVCTEESVLGLRDEPMGVFWLPPFRGELRKLAFVRRGHDEGQSVLQGFIGDWPLLNTELVGQVADLFPRAELKLEPREKSFDPAPSESSLSSIPALLVIPERPGEIAAAAWASIRKQLYLTWAITAAVLLLAGWGVHTLVALTNRRMQFAYAVTHELRTPLTTFRLYADMLSGGLVPEDAKQEYLDTLNVESLRLSSLVDSILEYARLENHRVRLSPVETDASVLLSTIAEGVEERCRENGIEATTENAVVNGSSFHTDVTLISQVAGVLINNACRHIRHVDHPRLLVRLSSDDSEMHLDVVDNGPGIDRRDARTVFKPFRRGRNAKVTAQGGIGLGLALAREWAKLLGGRLDLAARHDLELGGAHFRLTVPTRI